MSAALYALLVAVVWVAVAALFLAGGLIIAATREAVRTMKDRGHTGSER